MTKVTPGAPASPPNRPVDREDTPLVVVRDLHVHLGAGSDSVHAVRGVDLTLRPGRTLGLVGESGAGKTAVGLAIMGLLPDGATVSGSVRFDGTELLGLSDRRMSAYRGRKLAMISQDPAGALTPVRTVGDQLVAALRVHRTIGRATARRRAQELLDLVRLPDPRHALEAYPHELSGGMRQRVLIAMAVANEPRVIVADEPTSALDPVTQADVLDVLDGARVETGAAVLLITHDLDVVEGATDDVVVMFAGRAVETGPVDRVYADPRMPYTAGLLGSRPRSGLGGPQAPVRMQGALPDVSASHDLCLFAPRCPLAHAACLDAEPALRTVGPDHRAACVKGQDLRPGEGHHLFPTARSAVRPAPGADTGDVVLSVTNLHRHFARSDRLLGRRAGPETKAVDGLDFEVRQGECLAIVGESGGGKTTTLLEIMEMTPGEDTHVFLLGRPVVRPDRAQIKRLRREVQMVFQDPIEALDPRFTAYDIIAEPLRAHGVSPADCDTRVDELLTTVGLVPGHRYRHPRQLSGGQRQRLGIARALALRPRLLLLDEPVSALDVTLRSGVVDLLARLKEELGLSIVVASHDLTVVRQLADRVAVLHRGRFVEIGAAEAVLGDPAHPYTRAVLSGVRPPRTRARPDRPDRTDESSSRPRTVVDPTTPRCPFVAGCDVHDRLPPELAHRCLSQIPTLRDVGGDHRTACLHPTEQLESRGGGPPGDREVRAEPHPFDTPERNDHR